MSSELTTGDQAPGFALPDQDEKIRTCDEFKGKHLILYFYPKDNTTGCTAEALAFTAVYEELQESGVQVIGISPDSVTSHRNFINKHELKLVLLSDPDHQTSEAYGVWRLKKMYGREYFGIERTTFLIDPDGRIQDVWRKVRVKGHAGEVMSRLKEESGK